MKSVKILISVLTLLYSFAAAGVFAEEKNVSGSASVDVMSNYVWRGQKLSDEFVVQPSVGITYNGFGANLWANWDSDPSAYSTNEHTETDLTLSYSFSFDKFSFDAGYIYYALDAADDTQEIYFSAGYDTILSPSVTVYADFDEGEGVFIVASIGHSVELPNSLALNLGASASYNIENKLMGTDAGGDEFSNFYNGEVTASLSIPVTSNLSIEPKIAYTFALSDDSEDALEAIDVSGEKDSSIFYGGINATLSF